MFELYFKKVREKVSLTPAEEELCKSFFVVKKLRKRQYLLQEGEVNKYTAFVEKGALRSYTVGENGAEHILQFALEGWTIADIYSFITGEPSKYNIDALEDSDLLLLSKPAVDEMLLRVPKIQQYYYLQMQNAYVALQRRMTMNISQTAEEKYKTLLAAYPEIVQRVPQHMIASYLGVKPETLSRIRRKNL